jgi:hypothetical protein
MRSIGRCLASLIAAVVVSLPAYATFTNIVNTGSGGFGVEPPPSCAAGPSAFPVSCTANGENPTHIVSVGVAASAFGDAAGLHAQASSSMTALVSQGGPISVQATASSVLQDTLHITGAHPSIGYITITDTTHGFASGGQSSGLTQMDILNGLGTAIGDRECNFNNAGNCVLHDLVNFDAGISLRLLLDAFAAVQFSGSMVGAGTTGSSFANFVDGSFISAISFTDVNGNPLFLSFTADSGLTYPMPQPSNGVPEPGTLLLVAIAASMGIVKRKLAGRHNDHLRARSVGLI